MPRTVTGVDVSSSAAVLLRGHVKGNTFAVTDFAHQVVDAQDAREAWGELEAPFAPKDARVGVTGREVNVRYVRVPRLPDWQLKKLMRFEVEEVGGSSDSAVAADFNVLPEMPEVQDEDVVLLAMARESLLEELREDVSDLGGTLDAFTPNSIALYNAWLRFGVVLDDTVLIANVGADDIDVIVVRGRDLVFARNLSGGVRLFDRAIADRLAIDAKKAARVRRLMLDLTPGARFDDQNAERASRACSGPAGQIASLLQSTVAFAKSQVRIQNLRLDRVLVCGDGAEVEGLDAYLGSVMGTKVERFDPFTVVDTEKLDPEASAALEKHKYAAVVALGLATAASDSDAYGIEILPKAILQKREFTQGTLFLILAAVLAVAFLGQRFVKLRGEAVAAESSAASLQGQLSRLKRDDSATQALLASNAELGELAEDLRRIAGSGRQLATVVDALDGLMPPGFSIREFSTSFQADTELGIPKGSEAPIVTISGEAVEGIEENDKVFRRFAAALHAALPDYKILEQLGSTFSTFKLTITSFGPPAETADDAVAEEEVGG
ncbi:MAG: pilus assembly protein PilM [Planctomycetota bacterium]